jgi:hypothetical protein
VIFRKETGLPKPELDSYHIAIGSMLLESERLGSSKMGASERAGLFLHKT